MSVNQESDWEDVAGGASGRRSKERVYNEQHVAQHNFLRHVASEKEGKGAITLKYVCAHCKLVPVEDVLWWVCANHGVLGGSQAAGSGCKSETQPMTNNRPGIQCAWR